MKAVLPLAVVFALLALGVAGQMIFGGPAILWDAPLSALIFWIPCGLFILAFPAVMLWQKLKKWLSKF